MIYICENCGFLFRRVNQSICCPHCDTSHVREVTKEETEKLQRSYQENEAKKGTEEIEK